MLELDVNNAEHLAALPAELESRWGGVDGVLHAIAFAPEDALGGNFMTTPPESAATAFQTSAFSLKAIAAALAPLMPAGASIVGLDFDASVAWPIYDWMGVAKAALESVSRYLARDLGAQGIRVNLDQRRPARHRRRARHPRLSRSSPRSGPARRRSAGTSRTRASSPARSASCSPTSRAASPVRSSTSTAASTPSALRLSRNARLSAALGAVAIALSSILVKLSHASPSTAAIFRCAYALPLLALLAWREDRRPWSPILA